MDLIKAIGKLQFRDKCRLHQPQFHTYTYGFRSFKYSGSKLWNSLPRAIKNTNDINEFKKKYYRVVSDLRSLQTGDILLSFSISNASIYNVCLCHIYGRRISTLSVYVIFQLCLIFFVLRCYPLIRYFIHICMCMSVTWIFACTVHVLGSLHSYEW